MSISGNGYFLLMFLCGGLLTFRSQDVRIHSHNDYLQKIPFWHAFSAGAQSVEVDIYLRNDTLFATHSLDEIRVDRTLENLYLQPIRTVMDLGFDDESRLQLLVDIKSETHSTLEKLLSVIKPYEAYFLNGKVAVVISGNRPDEQRYHEYPAFVRFDYQSLEPIKEAEVWDKIALISLDFKKVSDWDGKTTLKQREKAVIQAVIDKAHSYGKPFRFWGTPDTLKAWKMFATWGVDYINTDRPGDCTLYFNSLN